MTLSLKAFTEKIQKLDSTLRGKVIQLLKKQSKVLLDDVRSRSAYDTGTYRSGWIVAKPKYVSGGTAQIIIYNTVPYSGVLVSGAKKGKDPWYFPNENNKKSKKLFEYKGRIWAGGIDPGREKAKGGAFANLAYDSKFINQISSDIWGIIREGV